MTRAKDISKIVTDADLSGTLDVTGAFTSQGIDDNADATAITITSAEKVGLGIDPSTLPSFISHAMKIANGGGLSITSPSSSDNRYIFFGTGTSSSDVQLAAIKNSSSELMFLGASGAERMRIDSNGNVGIGTSSPDNTLEVNGIINIKRSNELSVLSTTATGVANFEFGFNKSGGTTRGMPNDTAFINMRQGYPIVIATQETERIRIDGGGHVTMPYQPAFLAKPTSNITNLTINVDTTVTFGTEIFDQNSDFASNTFTAPVTGKYQLSLQIRFNQLDVDGTFYEVKIFTSNREYRNIIDMRPFDADVPNYTSIFTILADMDAGDTANVKVKPYNSGASQADIIAAHTYFSAFLAC